MRNPTVEIGRKRDFHTNFESSRRDFYHATRARRSRYCGFLVMIATAAISGRGGEVKIFTVEVSKLVCSHVFTQFPPRGFALFRNPCVCEAYWVRNSKFWYPCSLFLAYLLGLVKKDSEKNIDTTYPYSFFTTFDCVCGKKEPWKPLSIFCVLVGRNTHTIYNHCLLG